jgi:putative transcription factor
MCGSKEAAFVADIEGSLLNVCSVCGEYGTIKSRVIIEQPESKTEDQAINTTSEPEKEIMQIITSNYSKLIRDKREQLSLKQEDFAMKINEKASLIHKMETGEFEPSMELARKLEKFLNIKLVETHEEIRKPIVHEKSGSFTLGDFIKVKKK